MSNKHFIIFSNLTFLVPLGVALAHGLYLWSALIAGVIVLSFLYHISGKSHHAFYQLDHLFAWALIIFNSIMVLNVSFYNNIYFYITMGLVALGLTCYYHHRRSLFYHSCWHIISSLITLFSILTHIK